MTAKGKWVLLSLGTATLVAISLPGTIATLRNGSIREMRLEEYVSGNAGEKWLELSDCWIIPEHVIGTYDERGFSVHVRYDDVYAPLGTSPDDPGPYRVVLRVRDRTLRRRLERTLPTSGLDEVLGGRIGGDPERWPPLAAEPVRLDSVRGTVPYGILSMFSGADRGLIEREGDVPLHGSWVMLDQHAEPSMPVEGLFLAVAALALLSGFFWIPASERARLGRLEMARRREERLLAAERALDEPPPPPPPEPPPPPPPPPRAP